MVIFPGVGAFDHLKWTYDEAFVLFGREEWGGGGAFKQKISKNSNTLGVFRGDVEASISLVHYLQDWKLR